jgi:MFS family permease
VKDGRRPREFWVAAVAVNTVLTHSLAFILRPTVIYRAIELEVGTQWLGALGASFAVVPLLLAVPCGHLVDRYGERPLMLAGSALSLVSAVVLLWGGFNLAWLVTGCVLSGMGHLCLAVCQQSLVANRTSTGELDRAFGRYTFLVALGQAAGPALLVVVGGDATIPDTSAILGATVIMSCALVGSSVALPRDRVARGGGHATRGDAVGLLRRRGVARALTVSCISLAAIDICLAYLPALGADRGISAGSIGTLLTVRAVASMVTRLFTGRLVATVGRARLLASSLALSALAMALVPLTESFGLLVLLMAAVGLGLGVGQPLTLSWIVEAAPTGQRGTALSLRLTGNRLGQMLVPSAAGLVAVGAGASGVLFFTAGTLVSAAVVARKMVTNHADGGGAGTG